jgi:hypothetical protein
MGAIGFNDVLGIQGSALVIAPRQHQKPRRPSSAPANYHRSDNS